MTTGIQVRIGNENNILEMEDCSLITATYSIGEDRTAQLLLLGPNANGYNV